MLGSELISLDVNILHSHSSILYPNYVEPVLKQIKNNVQTQDGTKAVKVAYHVPRRDDEKQITNDKKPYILRFLERQWAVRTEVERESRVDSPRMKKKKKIDVMKKRASSDAPSTSSDPKTRRLS
ncbi:hypothetical protein OSTOST_05245 [Ostertagia ostertagi]